MRVSTRGTRPTMVKLVYLVLNPNKVSNCYTTPKLPKRGLLPSYSNAFIATSKLFKDI
jgi:hypothetical protein